MDPLNLIRLLKIRALTQIKSILVAHIRKEGVFLHCELVFKQGFAGLENGIKGSFRYIMKRNMCVIAGPNNKQTRVLESVKH